MCKRGVFVPWDFDKWDGPLVCSFCGEVQALKKTGCLNCGTWFANDAEWLDHRSTCSAGPYGFLDIQNPRSEGVETADSEAVGHSATPTPEMAFSSAQKVTQRLILGGRCRRGEHKLTKRNLYLSPKGVATCKDCRAERRKQSASRDFGASHGSESYASEPEQAA